MDGSKFPLCGKALKLEILSSHREIRLTSDDVPFYLQDCAVFVSPLYLTCTQLKTRAKMASPNLRCQCVFSEQTL